jgi:hypothetical protein
LKGQRPRTFRTLAATLAAALLAGLAAAQPAPNPPAPAQDASRVFVPIELNSGWLMHPGDDPGWADPALDDSGWTPYDVTGDLKTVLTGSRPEFVWYRLHLKVSPQEAGLALRQGSIAKAAEVYVNGELFTSEGRVQPFVSYTWNALVVRRIPDRMLAGGSLVIAVRAHIGKSEWAGQNPGLSSGNLTLGQENALRDVDWLNLLGQNLLGWIDHLLSIGVGVVALVLFASQRRQNEYLWIAALGLLTLVEAIQPFVSQFHNIPTHWEVLSDLLRVFTPYVWTSLYFSFIHRRVGWRWRTVLIVCGICNAFSAVQQLYLTLPLFVQFFTNLPFIILLSVVIPFMLAVHWRRGNREAGILLIPAVLFSLYIYAEVGLEILYQFPAWHTFAFHGLNLIDRFPAGPFTISLDPISNILSTLALAVIMLLRSTRMSRRQAILEGELAAAQQVQQVLLPDQAVTVPGFLIESVYQPAQQVGGDFFQILPAGDGGLLVVVGDVAGKGLPAAMLVSVLVGAIRAVADYTSDPAELLSSLNERLIGRSQGSFSTALAAHITADGWLTIANAGHLSPYLDGREVEIHPTLPLGVLGGVAYQTSQLYLAHGSRLTFYSDGVVEAQNAHGELFGFDRAQEISIQPAAAIVAAAERFGQEDDITVVTIAREESIATAA